MKNYTRKEIIQTIITIVVIIAGGSGLVLYNKQDTTNIIQPNNYIRLANNALMMSISGTTSAETVTNTGINYEYIDNRTFSN